MRNPLYFFLKHEIDKGAAYLKAQEPRSPLSQNACIKEKKENGSGEGETHRYGKISLNAEVGSLAINGKVYRLKKHHITIHETRIPQTYHSNYVYTAVLEDKAHQEFLLRVHFDMNQTVRKSPVLKFSDTLGAKIRLDDVGTGLAIELAQSYSYLVMSQLREEHQKLLREMEQDLGQRTEQLLLAPKTTDSVDDAIVTCLDLKEKAAYFIALGGSRYINKLLSTYLKSLNWQKYDLTKTLRDEDAMPYRFSEDIELSDEGDTIHGEDETIQDEVSGEASTSAPGSSKQKGHKKKRKPKSSREELEAMIRRMNGLKESCVDRESASIECIDYNTTAETAHELLNNCQDAEFITKHIGNVERCCRESRALCVNYLKQGLIAGQAMSNFSQYAESIPDNILFYLIQQGNIEQLKWLLSSGKFPIDQLSHAFRGIKYSLLEFAYKFNRLDCFELLLNQGASAMVNSQDGLPLAYHILSTPSSPFYESLMRFYAEEGRRQFLMQLSRILQHYLISNPNSDKELAIEHALTQYKIMIQMDIGTSGAVAVENFEAEHTYMKAVRASTGGQQYDRIINSPETMQLRRRCAVLTEQYKSMITPGERLSLCESQTAFLQKLTKHYKQTGGILTQQGATEVFTKVIKKLELLIEQRGIMKQIHLYSKKGHLNKNEIKEYQRLISQNNQLAKNIAELTDEFKVTTDRPSLSQRLVQFSKLFSESGAASASTSVATVVPDTHGSTSSAVAMSNVSSGIPVNLDDIDFEDPQLKDILRHLFEK